MSPSPMSPDIAPGHLHGHHPHFQLPIPRHRGFRLVLISIRRVELARPISRPCNCPVALLIMSISSTAMRYCGERVPEVLPVARCFTGFVPGSSDPRRTHSLSGRTEWSLTHWLMYIILSNQNSDFPSLAPTTIFIPSVTSLVLQCHPLRIYLTFHGLRHL